MKHLILATLAIVVTPHLIQGQEYFQYFDGEDLPFSYPIEITITDKSTPNAWQIGMPNKVKFREARTKPNAILTQLEGFYAAGDTSTFIASMNTQEALGSIFAFQWMQRIDFMEGDGGIVEYSVDKGVTWENPFDNPYVYAFYGFSAANVDTLANGDIAFVGKDDTWRNVWLCFEYGWLVTVGDSLSFRYTLASGPGGKEGEGWMIDNMYAAVTYTHTINEVKPTEYFSVYPNPVSDRVFLKTMKLDQYHVIEQMMLYDAQGRIVQEWANIPTHFFFDVNHYPAGQYNLVVLTNLRTVTVPVIIQHP